VTSGLQLALETLYGLERRRSDFRVEDTARLLDAMGRPQARFRSVHVAGTNGKGSVCALVERVLRAAGIRTGLFTSPHLVDYRERIRVAGRWLDEPELERRLAEIQSLESARGRTFFEVTTALGLDAFARHDVEWGVVEVGLGGRLDATNVLEPAVSAIVSVGLDHTEMLGRTHAEVAREKAGIAKPGTPLVAGQLPVAAERAARDVVESRGATWIRAADRVTLHDVRTDAAGATFVAEAAPWGRLPLALPLRGRHQVENARVALAVLAVLASGDAAGGLRLALPARAIADGFAAARWPGRLEPCPAEPRLWWDGAHNLEGIERLANAWRDDLGLPAPEAVVFAAARDKDAVAMLSVLRTLAPAAALFVARTANERALPPESLVEAAAEAGWADAIPRGDLATAVREALAGRARVLLAGSLFAVAEAMQACGGAPGAEA